MPIKPLFAWLLAGLLYLPALEGARAQSFEAGRDGRISVTRDYVELAKRIIRERLQETSPKHVKIFDQVEVRVIDDNKAIAFAHIEGKKRYVTISTAYTILSNLYTTQVFVFRNAKTFDREKCSRLVEDSITAMHTLSVAESIKHPALKPWRYCGVDDMPMSPDEVNLRFNDFYRPFHTSVMTILLGHEYTHHLLGHLPAKPASPEENRRIEHIADRSASYLLGDGRTRLPAAAMFYMLSRFRTGRDPFRIESNYAAHECRFMFFVRHDRVFNVGLSEKLFEEFMKNTPHFAGVYNDISKRLSVPPDQIPTCADMHFNDDDLFSVKP